MGSIVLLLLCVVIGLHTPAGKNFVRKQVLHFLRSKLDTEVQLGRINYALPKMLELEDVFFRDEARDTLLAVRKLRVDINMLALLSGKVVVQRLELAGIRAHVYRHAPDTAFNFTYIINAFTGEKPDSAPTAEKVQQANDTGSSLRFDVNRIYLDDIHIRFDDYTGGMRLAVDLERLQLSLRKMDPVKLDFGIRKLSVDGLAATFRQDTSYLPPSPDTGQPADFRLAADEIALDRVAFRYDDRLSKFLFDLNLGHLLVQPKEVDIKGQRIDIDRLALDSTRVSVLLGAASDVPQEIDTLADTIAAQGWRVHAGDIRLAGVHFKMDNTASPRQPYGMDYAHLDVRNLHCSMEDVLYTTDTISGNIRHIAVQEQGGLDLRELRTKFVYHPQGAVLRDLYLQTAQTVLQDHLEVTYPSLDALKTDMGALRMNINLAGSRIGFRDVLVFVPALREQAFFREHQHDQLKLDAALEGFMNDLSIRKFNLSGLSRTEVALTGRLKGLPDADRLAYDLDIRKLQSARADIAPLLPADLQAQLRLPDAFGMAGTVAGTSKDYNTQLAVMTTDGNAFVKGYLRMSPGKNREQYDLLLKTDRLNLGRILRQDSVLGRVSADFAVRGRSFDVKTMTAALRGTIHSAELKGYDYNSITMRGRMKDGEGRLRLRSEDPNAYLSLAADASFRDTFAAVVADIAIDSIDFQALHLYSDPFKLHTTIHADVPVANPDYPQATIVTGRPVLLLKGQRYLLDSLRIVSQPAGDSQHITADLGMLYAQLTGQMPLTKAGAVVQEHISRHYSAPADTAASARQQQRDTAALPENYNMQLTARVVDAPLLHAFAPALKRMDTIHVDAAVDTRNLELRLSAPRVVYDATEITGATATVTGSDSALTYKVALKKLTQGNLELIRTSLQGEVSPGEITANLKIQDTAGKDRFALAAALRRQDGDQALTLRQGLLLDYKAWQVAEPNRIVFGPQGFYVEGFAISAGEEAIRIHSDPTQYNAPLTAEIDHFIIGDITRMVSKKDTLLADGILSAQINLRQIKPEPLVAAQLEIRNLTVFNVSMGDLSARAEHQDAGTLHAEVSLEGQGNDIRVAGNYYLQPVQGNDFDFNIDLKAVSLKSMEGLAMGQIRNSGGFLRGSLQLRGTAQAPAIRGELRTDQLATTVSMLGMQYRMPEERIVFTDDGIRLDAFDILDSAGNKITLDGSVMTRDYKDMLLDMNVRARNFKALSSTVRDNKLFYGSVVISSNLNIKGKPAAPDIDGSIGINKGTAFTVAIPQSEAAIQSSEGIVMFVDMRDTGRYTLWEPVADTVPRLALNAGADINVNISIDSAAEFRVIIDPGTGDNLRVRGEAALNAAVTPGGELTLAGNYELREGAYQLRYNLIRRRFDIKPGSMITFSGDPLAANMDITAIYEANIAPYDLVEKQVPDPTQLNYYKQRLPFEVLLKMQGELMKPYITFDIDLPEGKSYRMASEGVDLVQARLSQLRTDTSELNKQVFAVLILNRFIGEDPFSSGAGGDVSSVARQSASRFLSAQLNKYAGSLIKGIDLSFDLASSEDYTTGERRDRTDLNIAASKNLFNNRLTVTVGNDFELEGPQSSTDQNTSLIPGNLAADYRLTADGRYTLRAYRQDQDEGVLEGYVTETGLNFIATYEYNRFKNLFNRKRRAREREERRKRQAEQEQQQDTGPAGSEKKKE